MLARPVLPLGAALLAALALLSAPAVRPAAAEAMALPGPADGAAPADARRPDSGGPAADAVVAVGGCTGALIAPDIVLTAAHCFPARQRMPRPAEAAPHACAGLSDQVRVQGRAWEPSDTWHPARGRKRVRVGHDGAAPLFETWAEAYALPRCADLALLRLAAPVPAEAAHPLPVLSRAPASGRLPHRTGLRHASYAGAPDGPPPGMRRATGEIRYWGENACVVVGLPPLRSDGRRLASGDSGAPLLMQDAAGGEVVAGILFVIGQPDAETCGAILPAPREQHGSWTPTWRQQVPGTDGDDIGAWLRRMAPAAEHR